MRTKNSWRKDMKNKFSHNLTKNNSFTYISSKNCKTTHCLCSCVG